MDLRLCTYVYLLCTYTFVWVYVRVLFCTCICICVCACSSDRALLHSYAPYILTHTDVQCFVYLRMANTHVKSHVCTYICTLDAKYAHSCWKLAWRLCLVYLHTTYICTYARTYVHAYSCMFVFVCTIWKALENSNSNRTATVATAALLKVLSGTQLWYPESIETSSSRRSRYQSITWFIVIMFIISSFSLRLSDLDLACFNNHNIHCIQSLDPSLCTLACLTRNWNFWSERRISIWIFKILIVSHAFNTFVCCAVKLHTFAPVYCDSTETNASVMYIGTPILVYIYICVHVHTCLHMNST